MAVSEGFIKLVRDTAKDLLDHDPAGSPQVSADAVATEIGRKLTPPASAVVEAAEVLLQRGQVRVDRQNPAEAYRISNP